MSDDVKDHIKLYYKIGATLLVLTVVTVAASYIDFAVPLTIVVALIIAATKGRRCNRQEPRRGSTRLSRSPGYPPRRTSVRSHRRAGNALV